MTLHSFGHAQARELVEGTRLVARAGREQLRLLLRQHLDGEVDLGAHGLSERPQLLILNQRPEAGELRDPVDRVEHVDLGVTVERGQVAVLGVSGREGHGVQVKIQDAEQIVHRYGVGVHDFDLEGRLNFLLCGQGEYEPVVKISIVVDDAVVDVCELHVVAQFGLHIDVRIQLMAAVLHFHDAVDDDTYLIEPTKTNDVLNKGFIFFLSFHHMRTLLKFQWNQGLAAVPFRAEYKIPFYGDARLISHLVACWVGDVLKRLTYLVDFRKDNYLRAYNSVQVLPHQRHIVG